MATALALVNRMRAKRRDATSNIITDRNGVAYLEILNGAINTVLEQKTWDFQKASDGRIITVPSFTGTVFGVTPGSTNFLFSTFGGTDAQLFGDFVTRVIGLGDPDFGNTAMRVETAGSNGAGVVTGTLSDEWPGGASLTGFQTVVYEYLLPTTVKEVISVRTIENDEPLAFTSSPEEFEENFPRPWDNLSSWPTIVCVGGTIHTTSSLLQFGDTGLALRVWPVPDTAYQLDYSYIYRQVRLAVDTDTMRPMPPAVEDVIVDLAVARVIIEIEKDLQTGLPLEANVMKQVDMLHRNYAPAAGKRPQMLSHDHTNPATNQLMWLPRQVSGLPT